LEICEKGVTAPASAEGQILR